MPKNWLCRLSPKTVALSLLSLSTPMLFVACQWLVEITPSTSLATDPELADVAEEGVEVLAAADADAARPPEAPALSAIAPVEDLCAQVEKYIGELENTLATIESGEEPYDDNKEKIGRDANTLAIIALCLGKHDQDNPCKAKASALLKAAQKMAATQDLDSAKKTMKQVKEAAAGKSLLQSELKWEKVASWPSLMKQVSLSNTKLKANIKPAKFKTKAKESAGHAALIAAIAQGSLADTSQTKSPEQVKQWYGFCAQLRDAAAAMNRSVHEGDATTASAAMQKIGQSCDDCHAVFRPENKIEE
jgi:hypothetical protein